MSGLAWSGLRRRRAGIPLADARALAGPAARTRLVRALLALLLAALLGGAFLAAREQPVHHSSFFAAGDSGIVVLDFSSSIGVPGYQRITNVLRPVVEANQPIGVVYFSDVGYVALPPGTPGRELRPFLRFLRTPPLGEFPSAAELARAERAFSRIEANPWSAAFRGGTRISAGLEVAREAVLREGGRGTVLLVSDLDDSLFDLPSLGETLARYRRDGVRLRVVPLFPSTEDRAFFRRSIGPGAFVTHAELLRNARSTEQRSLQSGFPLALVLLALALLAALAANELLCGRLEWGRRPA
ncbi:MAG TPA: vWA domain-containing protein [Gaiellaceae bacterium]|nr:vWA domain-containing protein [Gaiellaceae bacterium]